MEKNQNEELEPYHWNICDSGLFLTGYITIDDNIKARALKRIDEKFRERKLCIRQPKQSKELLHTILEKKR